MKKTLTIALISGLVAAPAAFAKGSFDDADRMLQVGNNYGISHFQSIEFDDDHDNEIELEGWMGQDWFVELDLNGNGELSLHPQDRKNCEGAPSLAEQRACHAGGRLR